jgi:hypothetical protein
VKVRKGFKLRYNTGTHKLDITDLKSIEEKKKFLAVLLLHVIQRNPDLINSLSSQVNDEVEIKEIICQNYEIATLLNLMRNLSNPKLNPWPQYLIKEPDNPDSYYLNNIPIRGLSPDLAWSMKNFIEKEKLGQSLPSTKLILSAIRYQWKHKLLKRIFDFLSLYYNPLKIYTAETIFKQTTLFHRNKFIVNANLMNDSFFINFNADLNLIINQSYAHVKVNDQIMITEPPISDVTLLRKFAQRIQPLIRDYFKLWFIEIEKIVLKVSDDSYTTDKPSDVEVKNITETIRTLVKLVDEKLIIEPVITKNEVVNHIKSRDSRGKPLTEDAAKKLDQISDWIIMQQLLNTLQLDKNITVFDIVSTDRLSYLKMGDKLVTDLYEVDLDLDQISIYKLDLSSLGIRTITKTSVDLLSKLRNLTGLDLSNNPGIQIENIHHDRLETLDLSHCGIEEPFNSVFPGLKHINLSYNNIISIDDEWFKGLPNLENLVLQANGLQTLDKQAFSIIPKLMDLDLSYNKDLILDRDVFAKLKKLRSLSLIDNSSIDELPTISSKLEKLELDGCNFGGKNFSDTDEIMDFLRGGP